MVERVALADRLLSRTTVDPVTGCHIWNGYRNADGYGEIKVDGVKLKVHRVAYALHVGDLQPGMVVDHLCRNRACWRPEHLEQVTNTENVRRGDAAILTVSQVLDIKTRLADGEMPTALARDYGVRPQTIWGIHRGARWSDVSLCSRHA